MDPDANLDEQLELATKAIDTIDHLHERVTDEETLPEQGGTEDFTDLIARAQHVVTCPGNPIMRPEAHDALCTCGAHRAAFVIRELLDDHERLCELVQALDGWHAAGGVLPLRWRRAP